jgi:Protein of unknown function (DUF2723)
LEKQYFDFDFKKWNTIGGWLVFAIALITFTLTVEPTMSFWDCGEYIATAAKLEVGHPPGAPLFQMIGAFFAMFAFNKEHIALMVNMTSVFSSAFTVLFLFWSSTMILKTMISRFTDLKQNEYIVILGSAFVGALTLTFSDSFWFNAVEAEVYAMATLLISLLFYLGLRWEQDMNTPRGNRWLVLISLVVGLSFGVHFMALLTIPSIGLLYYFKNYKTITLKNFIIANIAVVAVLLFIFKLLLPLTMSLFASSEIFMVNSIGLPFNSGTIIFTIFIIALFFYGLKITKEKGFVHVNTMVLCILFILIGFSTWIMLPVRANANPVINENKPSDATEVLAYYNREQYGENPLFYGTQFTDMFAGLDENNPYSDDKPNYERDYKTGRYEIVNNFKNAKQNSGDNHKAILPRMWSEEKATNYMEYCDPLSFKLNPNYDYAEDLPQYDIDPEKLTEDELAEATSQVRDEVAKNINKFRTVYAKGDISNDQVVRFLKQYKDYLIVEKPSTIDNISFMFEYQFGYMYVRYFLWNFVGRQGDDQGHGDILEGNWLSGIPFIDNLHLGSQDNIPTDAKNNKARNVYYFLPLILGLIGLFYNAKKDLKSFYVLLVLFLFTGLILKIYLNERPFEVRERDYALVGSFYVFAIWIGFGVYAIFDFIKAFIQPKLLAPIAIGTCLLAAPILMASQNWDDHDRSGKYTAVAMAKNYLDSCDKNAILFTIGDNDTFPLWYAQEVEHYRTDVKLINTSLFMTHWNIDQVKSKTYESDGAPISFTHNQYVGDKLDITIERKLTEERVDVRQFLDFIASDDERKMITLDNGQKIHFYPTDKIRIPVDKATIIKNKVVSPKYFDSIVPYIDVDLKDRQLYKNRLMMLDIVANNNWKRPIYFASGSSDDGDYLWMKDYLQHDGLVYKLVPIKTPLAKDASMIEMGQIDSEKLFATVMKWTWGNGEKTSIYHDTETRRESYYYRNTMGRLMDQLILEGKNEKALQVIELAMTKMPLNLSGNYTSVEPFAQGYYRLGKTEKARQLLTDLMNKYKENLKFYSSLNPKLQNTIGSDIYTSIELFRGLLNVVKEEKDMDFYKKNEPIFKTFEKTFERFVYE